MPGTSGGGAGGGTPWGAIAGIGLGLIGGIGKMFGRGKANRELKALAKQDPTYAADPRIMQMANQRLGLANTLLNARAPGAMQAERNIYSTQGNQLAGLNRSATDASQALAVAAGIGGQTQDAFTNLGQQEAQDYYRRLENQGQAQQGVMNESQRIEGNTYNDQVRKFDNKMAIQGAMQQNRQNTWGDISNLGFGLADFGMSGGFNGMFGGGGGRSGGGSMGGLGSLLGGMGAASGGGAAAGGLAGSLGAAAALSDIRMKENYFVVGKSNSGVNIYEFSYKGSPERFTGVMAQEVPWASKNIGGYMYVDYSKVDVPFKKIR